MGATLQGPPGFRRRALSLVSLVTDTIAEKTAAAGVTIDGALVKDNAVGSSGAPVTNVIATTLTSDTIAEKTAAAGVTIDGALVKDNAVGSTGAPVANVIATTLTSDTIAEKTAAAGVTIDACLVKDGAAAKVSGFVSTEQTGTGSSQNVAHGLGVIPSKVLFSFSELPAGLAAGSDFAVGVHDSTNVLVTVTTGIKFYVIALP